MRDKVRETETGTSTKTKKKTETESKSWGRDRQRERDWQGDKERGSDRRKDIKIDRNRKRHRVGYVER